MNARVLSLFDGMACGMLAFMSAGVEVESYDAYEIDKYAVQTATHNFPIIAEHGDVFAADFTQYEGVDFLIGGSPCTYWSIAQTKNRETVASGMGWELFSQYVRALNEAKPKYFIYENNKSMSKQIRASIDETFGFEAVCINSALVSAQNRQRLYWVGKRNEDGTYSRVNVEQPEDRGILLKDVLDGAMAVEAVGTNTEGKAHALTVSYVGAMPMPSGELSTSAGFRIYSTEAKGRYLCANGGGAGAKTGLYAVPINATADGKAKTISASYAYKGDGEGSLKSELFPDNPIKQTSNYVAVPMTYETKRIETLVDKFGYLPEMFNKYNTSEITDKSPTITAAVGVSNTSAEVSIVEKIAVPAMPIREATEKGFTEVELGDCVDLAMPNSKTRRGRKMADKANCMQTSNEFYQYVGYAIEFDEDGKPVKAAGTDGKSISVYEVLDGKITIKGKQYPIKLRDGFYIIRKLTVSECKRLQTVPEWYEFPVSNSQAYKMLGNGWTVEVIAHLVRAALSGKVCGEERQLNLFEEDMTDDRNDE